MKKSIRFLFYLCVAGLIGGCATILSGKTQKINVTTANGNQETALVDGKTYTVPSIIDVDRQDKDIVIANEKCPNRQALLTKSVNPTFWVNILSGGAFGSTTDYASHDMWQYDQKNIALPECPSK
ncbi:MAG: hypothetical protein M0Z48_06995 [Nitrospiraceae bacterium]|nr:hypothetical protein [Nitrospiraceae bacterium]